jgi:hypothetical protein
MLIASYAHADNCFITALEFETWRVNFNRARTGSPGIGAQEAVDMGNFMGFVEGIHDSMSVEKLICSPESLRKGDVQLLVERELNDYLKDHSLVPSQTCAADVVKMIFKKMFPCGQPEPPM